jgi:hypothetical protein
MTVNSSPQTSRSQSYLSLTSLETPDPVAKVLKALNLTHTLAKYQAQQVQQSNSSMDDRTFTKKRKYNDFDPFVNIA